MLKVTALALVAGADAKWPLRSPHADAVPPTFDCAMRKAAYSFGQKTLPRLGAFESLFYALDLNAPDCKGEMKAPPVEAVAKPALSLPEDALFVNPGESIQAAADLAAKAPKGNSRTVVLRDGTHYLSAPIQLDARHSGLSFIAYPGESPVVSGGVKLDVKWAAYDTSGGKNIWVADVGSQVKDVPGLQVEGVRATRARFPNLPGGVEVSPGYGGMISGGDAGWTPPDFNKYGKVAFYTDNITEHDRPNAGWFEHYMIGTNGLCSVYE